MGCKSTFTAVAAVAVAAAADAVAAADAAADDAAARPKNYEECDWPKNYEESDPPLLLIRVALSKQLQKSVAKKLCRAKKI